MSCQLPSVKRKAADVATLIEIYNPDIVCGTETWLHGEIFPDSYMVFRRDRVTDSDGGGVLHAIKKELVATKVNDTSD